MKKTILFIVSVVTILSANIFAQRTTDIEGGKDNPYVSRFKGSVMEWYQQKNFDHYFVIMDKDNNHQLESHEIEGKVTRLQYSSAKEHASFEIYKSYESALKSAGFEILISLNDKAGPARASFDENIYSEEFNGFNPLPRGAIGPDGRDGYGYIVAKGNKNGEEVYVVVYVTYYGWPLTTIDVVEVKPMEKDLVTAKLIDSELKSNGHIAIYDIHFDTGKSEVKIESAVALKNIAEFLNGHKDKKYIIVGHTDNTGDFDSNMKLSFDRATSVVAELIGKYGVSDKMLKVYGVGQVAPVTTNLTNKGKAGNRRIELVEQ